MKNNIKQSLRSLLLVCSLFLLTFHSYTQCPGVSVNTLFGPATFNGITVTSTQSGAVSTYPTDYSACGVNTPANSIIVGSGATSSFSITFNFSEPVNDLIFAFTGTGNVINEVFNFNTNTGTPSLSLGTNCFSSVSSNVLTSGLGSPSATGAGAVVTVSSPGGAYTSLTLSGPGGASGSIVTLCSSSVVSLVCAIDDPGAISGTCISPSNDLQFSLNLTGSNIGSTYMVSGATPTTGTYGTATTFTIASGADGTDKMITVTDDTDSSCTRDITITGVAACFSCDSAADGPHFLGLTRSTWMTIGIVTGIASVSGLLMRRFMF